MEVWYSIRIPKNMNTYVFAAIWRSTAKRIKVEAKNEEKAWAKAIKRKDIRGCESLRLERVEEKWVT